MKSIEGENSWIDFSDTGDIILDSFLVDEDNNQISEKQIIYIREDGEKKILPMIAEEVEKIESMSFLQDGRVGGNLVEQLIDGKQTEFGNPNNELLGMVVKEKGEFLVLFSNNKLMNYTYDSDAPII